jgi:hypothetical protein
MSTYSSIAQNDIGAARAQQPVLVGAEAGAYACLWDRHACCHCQDSPVSPTRGVDVAFLTLGNHAQTGKSIVADMGALHGECGRTCMKLNLPQVSWRPGGPSTKLA